MNYSRMKTKGLLNRPAVEEFCALDLFLDAKEAKLAVKGKARRDWEGLICLQLADVLERTHRGFGGF